MAFEFNSEKSNKIKEALKKNDSEALDSTDKIELSPKDEQTSPSNNEKISNDKNSTSVNKKADVAKRPPRKIKEDSEESVKAINKLVKKRTLNQIDNNPPVEFKQRYNIMLDPSVKKKADTLAQEKNFKSTSSFLNELIKNL